MSRIANYASQQSINSYLLKVQTRLQDSQLQLASKNKAQDYTGIGFDTQRLVSYEVNASTLDNFTRNNDISDVYISTTTTSVTSMETIVNDFRKELAKNNTLTPTDVNVIRVLQEKAFAAMQSMGTYLNENVGGRYLFSGNRTDTVPVDMGLTTLTAFQEKYDGISINYPTTRAKHMVNFDLSADSAAQTNWLTFTQDSDGNAATAGTSTITASTAQFSNMAVGSVFTVSGTANNNGTYEVSAVNAAGTIVDVTTVMQTDELNVAAAVVTPTGGTALTSANFTDVTFNRAAGTMVATAASSLTSLTAGSSFTVTGTAQNNGTFMVQSNDGTTVTIKQTKLTDEGTALTPTLSTGATSLAFTNNAAANDRITGVASQFSAVTPGMQMTITGATNAGNNGTFTVLSVASDGSYVDVLETLVTDVTSGAETATVPRADGRIKTSNYYNGDNFSHSHRVSENETLTLDLNASDPAFERAIRAMGMIAQGKFGTAGGIEQTGNNQRITDALNLLDLSLKPNATTNPQYEAGFTNSLQQSIVTLTDYTIVTSRASTSNKKLSDYLNVQISKMEKINELDVVTGLLNDQNALEASYKAMATIRGLSLVNYL